MTKTTSDQFMELRQAIIELLIAVCKELKIDIPVKWLDERTKGFRK